MSSFTPSAFPALHPRDALLNAHLKSSVLLAIYLIVGCALAVLSLLGVGYATQLTGLWTWLPYASMAAMVLWFALGGWVITQHQRKLQTTSRTYSNYVQRHTRPTPSPATTSLVDVEPWELRAFWGTAPQPAKPVPSTATRPHLPLSYTKVPNSALIPRSTPAATAAWDAAAAQDIDVIATIEGHQPLRPISLFGSAQ